MFRTTIVLIAMFAGIAPMLPAQLQVVNMTGTTFVDTTSNTNVTTVMLGTQVRWTYVSGFQHTVTATGGAFASGTLSATNTQFNYTTTSAGSFPYQCNFHTACCNMTGTLIVLPPPSYPLTGESLRLRTGVNGAVNDVDVKNANPGNSLAIRLDSPGGTFNGAPPLIAGQLFTTGTPPASPAGFPSIHVDPFASPAPFLIFDGLASPFGPMGLPAAGLELVFPAIPPGLAGLSLMIQGLSLSPLSLNHIFAATNGHEIRFL